MNIYSLLLEDEKLIIKLSDICLLKGMIFDVIANKMPRLASMLVVTLILDEK